MGLLDDAIREHLDLKRRRGADPAEVTRLEQEALGPVRREAAPAEPADEHHDESHAHEPAAAEHAHNVELGGAAAVAPEASADSADRAGGDEDARPPAEGPVGAHPESTGPARQAAEPEHEEPRRQDPRHTDVADQPTTEYRVEDHHDEDEHEASAAHGGPDEDVLEETPEFLQETPEHDRLWFEQRPPRDFDFDG